MVMEVVWNVLPDILSTKEIANYAWVILKTVLHVITLHVRCVNQPIFYLDKQIKTQALADNAQHMVVRGAGHKMRQ